MKMFLEIKGSVWYIDQLTFHICMDAGFLKQWGHFRSVLLFSFTPPTYWVDKHKDTFWTLFNWGKKKLKKKKTMICSWGAFQHWHA